MPDQQKYTNKLNGSHVLVIGGSAGIGYGVAEACLEYGAHVSISSSQESRIDDALSKLRAAYPSASSRVRGFSCNLADQANLEANIASLFEQVGTVDHIIFTAGDRLAQMPLEEVTLDRTIQAGMVRFFAPIMVAKYGSKHLTPGPKSSIVLTTGSVSERPIPNWAVVGSFAGAMHAMTRGLALDLKPIRVNLISPGLVDTDLWAHMSEEEKRAYFKKTEETLPTGRVAQVEDVVEAYLYCMMDKNVTGSVISTNSGHLLVG